MLTGIIFILLGAFWLLIAALTCRRGTFSMFLYPLAGVGFIVWGIVYIFMNATLAETLMFTLFLALAICVFLFIYGKKKKEDEQPTGFSEVMTPEPTAEEIFLTDAYRDEEEEVKNRPVS